MMTSGVLRFGGLEGVDGGVEVIGEDDHGGRGSS